MLSINKRILLYSLLVLAIGSVVALTGLFKITANIIAPKQKIIESISVGYAYKLSFENITPVHFNVRQIGNKFIINNIVLNDSADLQIIPIYFKIEPYENTSYKPIIYVNLRSREFDLGAPVLIVLASLKGLFDVRDLIKFVFNKDSSIKYNDTELEVLSYTFCDLTEYSCKLYYEESKYDEDYNYDILIITRPPYDDRTWKLEIEII